MLVLVLVRRVPQASVPLGQADTPFCRSRGLPTYTLDFNGSSAPVVFADPNLMAWPSALNASGTLVGRLLGRSNLGPETYDSDMGAMSGWRPAAAPGRGAGRRPGHQ